MKVFLISNYSGRLDEGALNIAYHLHQNLQSKQDVQLLNIDKKKSIKFWNTLINYKSDITHFFFHSLSIKGLIFIKIIKMITQSKTIVFVTQTPKLPTYKILKFMYKLLKPNLILVQSEKSKQILTKINYSTTFFPSGVDIKKFSPIIREQKNKLRKKYGFNENDFIVLHIGPIKKGRNQKALLKLNDVKIVLVGSVTSGFDEEVLNEVSKNATVWNKFFPNIEELYNISDVYIFPVFEDRNSIDMPLSVLEAMACNLPVISTKYGSLDKFFIENNGLFFVKNPEDFQKIIIEVKNSNLDVNTREKVLDYSWEKVADKITKIYAEQIV